MSKWNITLHEMDGSTKTVQLDMPKEFDEQVEKEKKIWCKCKEMKKKKAIENVEYVENYMGVNHGYICPKCKKFVQIG